MCFENCWSCRIHFSHCLLQAVYPDYPGPHNNGGADSSLPAPHAPMSFLPLNSKEFSEFTLLHLHILQHICQASVSSHWLFSLFRTPSSQIRTRSLLHFLQTLESECYLLLLPPFLLNLVPSACSIT